MVVRSLQSTLNRGVRPGIGINKEATPILTLLPLWLPFPTIFQIFLSSERNCEARRSILYNYMERNLSVGLSDASPTLYFPNLHPACRETG